MTLWPRYGYLYKPTKPVKCADLDGYKWVYVEAPPKLAHQMGGLPVSRNEFGLIATNKMVLETAREKAGLSRVKEGTLNDPKPKKKAEG